MAELVFEEDGVGYQTLVGLVREAVAHYEQVLETAGLDHAAIERGEAARSDLSRELKPIIAHGALKLPTPTELNSIGTFLESEREWGGDSVNRQDHLNSFMGSNVARHLYAVANSAEIRGMLPHRTALVIEANGTMSRHHENFTEDCQGIHGPSVALLDYLAIDPTFRGLDALKLAHSGPKSRIAFHDTTWMRPDESPFPPGSIAVSIRPVYINPYPRATDYYGRGDRISPAKLHRYYLGELDEVPDKVQLPYAHDRSEYTASRSFAAIHNPEHWDTQELLTGKEAKVLKRNEDTDTLPRATNARNFRAAVKRKPKLDKICEEWNKHRAADVFARIQPEINGIATVLAEGKSEGETGWISPRKWVEEQREQGHLVVEGYTYEPAGKLIATGRNCATAFRRTA